jgi:hypothetical protein
MSNFGNLLKEFMLISNALKAENQVLFLSDISALREELLKCQADAMKREREKENTATFNEDAREVSPPPTAASSEDMDVSQASLPGLYFGGIIIGHFYFGLN